MKPKSKANKMKRPTTVGSGDLLGICIVFKSMASAKKWVKEKYMPLVQ
jgi:hypothetical protein